MFFARMVFLAVASTGCRTETPLKSADNEPPCAGLVAFDPRVGAGINPEIDSTTGRSDYSLIYVVSADGTSIAMRFRGPSEALSAGLAKEVVHFGPWSEIVGRVARSEYRVVLARWRCGADGKLERAFVRTDPILELRPLGLRPGQLVSDVEWRPLVNGHGVGAWRAD